MSTENLVKLNIPGKFNLMVPKGDTGLSSPFGKGKKHAKYLLKSPVKPHVVTKDGKLNNEDAIDAQFKMPEELKGKITQEEYEQLMDTTLESCEANYKMIGKQIDASIQAIQEVTKEDNSKYFPYMPEREKFKTLVDMIVSDRNYLKKELDSIRGIYTKYLNEDGTVKADFPKWDSYMLEFVSDVRLRLLVCGNRAQRLIEPSIKHVSDFFTSMKIGYYVEHMDEAPEDIKKFIQERLPTYVNKEMPKA